MKTALVLLLLSACAALAAAPTVPANPNANPKARALLKYFQSLAGRADKHIVSGQFTDFGNGAKLQLMDQIHDKTGHWPAMIGVDYADLGRGSLTFTHGPQSPPGDFDYRRFLDGVRKDFPNTCFFKCWNWKWSLAQNPNAKEMLSDPAVVKREDLPPEWSGAGK
jgi:hypothetical protein